MGIQFPEKSHRSASLKKLPRQVGVAVLGAAKEVPRNVRDSFRQTNTREALTEKLGREPTPDEVRQERLNAGARKLVGTFTNVTALVSYVTLAAALAYRASQGSADNRLVKPLAKGLGDEAFNRVALGSMVNKLPAAALGALTLAMTSNLGASLAVTGAGIGLSKGFDFKLANTLRLTRKSAG